MFEPTRVSLVIASTPSQYFYHNVRTYTCMHFDIRITNVTMTISALPIQHHGTIIECSHSHVCKYSGHSPFLHFDIVYFSSLSRLVLHTHSDQLYDVYYNSICWLCMIYFQHFYGAGKHPRVHFIHGYVRLLMTVMISTKLASHTHSPHLYDIYYNFICLLCMLYFQHFMILESIQGYILFMITVSYFIRCDGPIF